MALPEMSIVRDGQVSPLRVPPHMGKDAIPQILTFSGLFTGANHTYYTPDQAVQQSLEDCWAMRNDLQIMAPLEARARLTALLPWHLDVEGGQDKHKDLLAELKRLIERIPHFTKFKTCLMDALWYGRAAVQYDWRWVQTMGGQRLLPRNWIPVNGDKLIFKYDDGTYDFDWDNIGIRVASASGYGNVVVPKDYKDRVQSTQWGMGYFLTPAERQLMTIHKHMIEDGPYERPLYAGSIHGVGIRNRIYWTWFMKQQAMRELMNIIERVGGGIRIYFYPAHDDEAKKKVEALAQQNRMETALLVPRDGTGIDLYGVEMVDVNPSGIELLQRIVHEFFGHQMLRYILGQTLSSEAAATGLGSGVADLHAQTLRQVVEWDANNLEETLTELVNRIKDLNFPDYRGLYVRFKLDLDSPEIEKRLAAIKNAWEMGVTIKESEVSSLLQLEKPGPNDTVLPPNPQLAASQQQQQGMGGQAGGPAAANPQQDAQSILSANANVLRRSLQQILAGSNPAG